MAVKGYHVYPGHLRFYDELILFKRLAGQPVPLVDQNYVYRARFSLIPDLFKPRCGSLASAYVFGYFFYDFASVGIGV